MTAPHQNDDVFDKVCDELMKIQDEVKKQREILEENMLGSSQSLNSWGLREIEGTDKNIINQSEAIYTLTQQLKCRELEIGIFKEKLMDSLQANSDYQDNMKEITDSLESLDQKIRLQFLEGSEIPAPQKNLNQSLSMDRINQILSQMQNSIDSAAARVKQRKQKINPTIHKLNSELQEMNNKNEQLISFIDERKKYSEKLKFRIKELKEQIKILQKKNEENEKYLEELQKWEITLDLKFRKRNQLINMIKILIYKLRKMEKNAKNVEPVDLNELSNVGKQFKLGGQESSPMKKIAKPSSVEPLESAGSMNLKKPLGIRKIMTLSSTVTYSPPISPAISPKIKH